MQAWGEIYGHHGDFDLAVNNGISKKQNKMRKKKKERQKGKK